MNGDTREWWIVQSGTLRFTVDGREPVVATKGVMVQVPYRTLYQIENVGTEPALRFEVNVTRARKLYPMDETPVPVSGFEYVKTRVTGGRGVLDPQNRPVVDFNKVVAGQERGGAFVTDDRSFANIIMGPYQKPQPGNKGHYHEEGGEFWLIMLGKIRYNIEGLQEFEADEGDVVYVPRQTWHLASFGGQEGSALVPPGDERLPVSGAHVRGGLRWTDVGDSEDLRSAAVVHAYVAVAACSRHAAPRRLQRRTGSSSPRRCAAATARPGTVTLPTGYPERPFVRVEFDKLTWRPTEGNTLGVETAVVEGDPSKPGYYLTINHFPAGVMSRPHYHPDERYVIVLRGTWHTDEGDVFRPKQTVPLKPGDFMRHPKGGPHYDGALDEDTWVAISGYGPTKATVIDGGELFGKSR